MAPVNACAKKHFLHGYTNRFNLADLALVVALFQTEI